MSDYRYVSAELAAVLGVKPNSKQTWRSILKGVHAYVDRHHLRLKSDGRQIKPDSNLAAVLGARTQSQMRIAGAVLRHSKACGP